MKRHSFDVVVIGSGPAGQKAAIQAAEAGCMVGLVERDNRAGGACVHSGTIPSKTLRENALQLTRTRRVVRDFNLDLEQQEPMTHLMSRLQQVLSSHDSFISDQLERAGVEWIHGRARFADPHTLLVNKVDGQTWELRSRYIVLATGSSPRDPDNIPIDHEHILDSDSILSMCYLPKSLVVIGSGVIASEYASIFAILGSRVTMIDRYPRPLGFLDPELCDAFVRNFESFGGTYLGERDIASMKWNGLEVEVELENGDTVRAEKAIAAAGRIANLEYLELDKAELSANERGLMDVDEFCRTRQPHIYAVGDVIGAPALASSSMEQGRRAVRHALGLPLGAPSHTIPAGIFTIPEIASAGLTEVQAREKHGSVMVGSTTFDEVARGQIDGIQDGMLKLVCDSDGRKVLGVQIVGEGATELIHMGQIAMVEGLDVDMFVENIFNFPTLAEAYRLAALDIINRRPKTEAPARAATA
ncbi:MAG: Si-specific NAD(P)(+) transhydrogenase [Xanthomonadales bacterium]|nr:Si-specific NAD(P)(+) transhydrogenase [Xanthomonadales bacterium]